MKRELKAAVIAALEGKLPITVHTGGKDWKIEAMQTAEPGNQFINMRVRDADGNLITYLTVTVKESL